MTPKNQKTEYWYVNSVRKESLESFIDRNFKEGWFAHQVIPVNGSIHLGAAYIIFYKF